MKILTTSILFTCILIMSNQAFASCAFFEKRADRICGRMSTACNRNIPIGCGFHTARCFASTIPLHTCKKD